MDVDPATGKTHVLVSAAKMENLERQQRLEQDRDHRQRYSLASYVWAPDSTHLLFDSNGRLWLYDLRNGTGIEIGLFGPPLGRRSQVLSRRLRPSRSSRITAWP